MECYTKRQFGIFIVYKYKLYVVMKPTELIMTHVELPYNSKFNIYHNSHTSAAPFSALKKNKTLIFPSSLSLTLSHSPNPPHQKGPFHKTDKQTTLPLIIGPQCPRGDRPQQPFSNWNTRAHMRYSRTFPLAERAQRSEARRGGGGELKYTMRTADHWRIRERKAEERKRTRFVSGGGMA